MMKTKYTKYNSLKYSEKNRRDEKLVKINNPFPWWAHVFVVLTLSSNPLTYSQIRKVLKKYKIYIDSKNVALLNASDGVSPEDAHRQYGEELLSNCELLNLKTNSLVSLTSFTEVKYYFKSRKYAKKELLKKYPAFQCIYDVIISTELEKE